MKRYIAVLIPKKKGGWSVLFPDFPGCTTQGETADEAIEMAHDALAGHTASLLAHGHELPEARSVKQIKVDPRFDPMQGFHWGEARTARISIA